MLCLQADGTTALVASLAGFVRSCGYRLKDLRCEISLCNDCDKEEVVGLCRAVADSRVHRLELLLLGGEDLPRLRDCWW